MKREFVFLALVTDAFGGHGGIAQYNRDLLEALAGNGAASSIIVIPRNSPDSVLTPDRVRQTGPQPSRVLYAVAVVWHVLFRRIDVVFCGHLFMAPLAFLIARLKRAKLIVQMHGIEAWQLPTFLRRLAVEAADLVLCVSRHTRAQVLNWAAIAPERIVVLPNTVGADFTPGDSLALRRAWGLEGKCVLLTVGRMSALERYKGHDRVIRAIPRLVADGHDAIYVIVGDGDDIGRLRSLADQEHVADRVRFMHAVTQEMLINVYRMADLFVMPSTGEGFGITFLEAMACGTPALGLGVGGAADALADGELGVVATEDDLPSALARALAQPCADAHKLAAAVEHRFGRTKFAVQACAAIARMRAAA